MSIIQDALRRKEPAPAPAAAAPPQPVAFPPPPLPPQHARRPPSLLLIVAMIAAIVAGAAFFAYRSGVLRRVLGRPTAGSDQAPSPQPDGSVPTGGLTARPPDRTSDRKGVTADATNFAQGTGPTDAPAPVAESTPAAPADAATGPAGMPRTAQNSASVPGAVSNAATKAAKSAAVRWPNFMVRGVIAGKAGAGSVIMDKALVDVGQSTSSGIRVVSLTPDGVVLEFQGQQRTVSVGSGIP